MTLTDLAETLKTLDANASLVFSTPNAVIGGGYHVTELKVLNITSIDCAGRTSDWREAALQLLDGSTGEHMKVGKFLGILEGSLRKVDGLSDAPVHVEFAPNNAGLRRFEIGAVRHTQDKVEVALSETKATCKPAFAFQSQPKPGEGRDVAKCCQ